MKDTVHFFLWGGGDLAIHLSTCRPGSLCEPNIISIYFPCLKSASKGTEEGLSQYASAALLILKCRLTEELFQQGLIPRFFPPFTPPVEATHTKQLHDLTFSALTRSEKHRKKFKNVAFSAAACGIIPDEERQKVINLVPNTRLHIWDLCFWLTSIFVIIPWGLKQMIWIWKHMGPVQ